MAPKNQQPAPNTSLDQQPQGAAFGVGAFTAQPRPKTSGELDQAPPPRDPVNWDKLRPQKQADSSTSLNAENSTARTGDAIRNLGNDLAKGTGLAALTQAVEHAEGCAAVLRGKGAFGFANARIVISGQAGDLLAELNRAEMGLSADRPSPTDLQPLIERLSAALSTMFAVARYNKLPMREAHLEDLFDEEDKLRVTYAGLERANRADAYYDVDLGRHENDGATPDASSLATKALKGNEDGFRDDVDPKESFHKRDDVVNAIASFGNSVGLALSTGLGKAKTLITEPERPMPKSIAEHLVEGLLAILTAEGGAMLGNLIGAAVKAGVKAVGAEDGLPRSISEAIVDGYKDSLKEIVITGGKAAIDNAPTQASVSPRSLFLDAADAQAAKAITHVAKRFLAVDQDLKRTPVESLLTLAGALSESLLKEIETNYTDIVVHQWVNLLHDAGKQGFDLQHPENQKRSKLDDLGDPVGTVQIAVSVGLDGSLSLRGAQLIGVSAAIRDHIREEGERNSLGSLPLNRTVQGVAPLPLDEQVTTTVEPIGRFSLDAQSKLTPPDVLSIKQRRAWMSVARQLPPPTAGDIFDGSLAGSDADVYEGMNKVAAWLKTIPAGKISEGNE